MLERLGLWLVEGIGTLGYPGIVLLMALESSVFPVPSELVMPPAGYLAATGKMNLLVALACGTVGSLVGAYANYFVASRVGRWIFIRYGRWVLLSEKSLERTERFFASHGEIATFIGRLLPVVRHLISIPAGLAGMNHLKFTLYTLAGAAIWCTVLTYFGYFIGAEQEVIRKHFSKVLLGTAVFCAALIAVYVWRLRRNARADRDQPAPPAAS